jgi:hypothetical protein
LMLFAGVRDALDPLRGERRFRELLVRIGTDHSLARYV